MEYSHPSLDRIIILATHQAGIIEHLLPDLVYHRLSVCAFFIDTRENYVAMTFAPLATLWKYAVFGQLWLLKLDPLSCKHRAQGQDVNWLDLIFSLLYAFRRSFHPILHHADAKSHRISDMAIPLLSSLSTLTKYLQCLPSCVHLVHY